MSQRLWMLGTKLRSCSTAEPSLQLLASCLEAMMPQMCAQVQMWTRTEEKKIQRCCKPCTRPKQVGSKPCFLSYPGKGFTADTFYVPFHQTKHIKRHNKVKSQAWRETSENKTTPFAEEAKTGKVLLF